MKEMTKEKLGQVYMDRRNKFIQKMKSEKIDAVIFEDNEDHRDPNVRYFTGHPSDAALIISQSGISVLIPWDENLALKNAFVERIIPSTRYERNTLRAIKAVLSTMNFSSQKIEISPATPYPKFLEYVDELNAYDVLCKEKGVHSYATQMRATKDEYEIECVKEAARIGDLIIAQIEKQIKSGKIKTESDVALLIERECRIHGCEKTGFDTLAAGPERSFAIHAFPGYTAGEWPGKGLSILDFGVVYKGYTSDTTLTVAKGKLSAEQKKLLDLVQKAFDECLELYKKDVPVKSAAAKADEIFTKAKRAMPHGLGHGIGLQIHEEPFVRQRAEPECVFKPGMIVTLEPGLYDPELGGVRLENDVLITEDGNQVISHSKILVID
ncbi:MAG: Xaa-Pro peptidase family protein [Treponema sp.]|nr:Xaa-Pro peptidase family protein [Treponema sp.]